MLDGTLGPGGPFLDYDYQARIGPAFAANPGQIAGVIVEPVVEAIRVASGVKVVSLASALSCNILQRDLVKIGDAGDVPENVTEIFSEVRA